MVKGSSTKTQGRTVPESTATFTTMDTPEQQSTVKPKPREFSFEDEELSWIPSSQFRYYPYPTIKDTKSTAPIDPKEIKIRGLVTRVWLNKSKENDFGHTLHLDVGDEEVARIRSLIEEWEGLPETGFAYPWEGNNVRMKREANNDGEFAGKVTEAGTGAELLIHRVRMGCEVTVGVVPRIWVFEWKKGCVLEMEDIKLENGGFSRFVRRSR
jgi:hypothetical protein